VSAPKSGYCIGTSKKPWYEVGRWSDLRFAESCAYSYLGNTVTPLLTESDIFHRKRRFRRVCSVANAVVSTITIAYCDCHQFGVFFCRKMFKEKSYSRSTDFDIIGLLQVSYAKFVNVPKSCSISRDFDEKVIFGRWALTRRSALSAQPAPAFLCIHSALCDILNYVLDSMQVLCCSNLLVCHSS